MVRLYKRNPIPPPKMRYHRKIPLLRQYKKTAPSTPVSRKNIMSSRHCRRCAVYLYRFRETDFSPSSALHRSGLHRYPRRRTRKLRMRPPSAAQSPRNPSAAEIMQKISYSAPSITPNSTAAGTADKSPAALASARMACSVAMSYAAVVIAAAGRGIRPRSLPWYRRYSTAR